MSGAGLRLSTRKRAFSPKSSRRGNPLRDPGPKRTEPVIRLQCDRLPRPPGEAASRKTRPGRIPGRFIRMPGVDASPAARHPRLLGGSGTRCARHGESRTRLTADTTSLDVAGSGVSPCWSGRSLTGVRGRPPRPWRPGRRRRQLLLSRPRWRQTHVGHIGRLPAKSARWLWSQ